MVDGRGFGPLPMSAPEADRGTTRRPSSIRETRPRSRASRSTLASTPKPQIAYNLRRYSSLGLIFGGGLAKVHTHPLFAEWLPLVVEVRGVEPLPVLVGTRPAHHATPDVIQNGQRVSVAQTKITCWPFCFLVLLFVRRLRVGFLSLLSLDGFGVPLLQSEEAVRQAMTCAD